MNTYFNTTTNRFFFIFGETSDEFCESNLRFVNLDKILNKHLKKLDYERIVFYQRNKGLRCLDRTSFDLAFNSNKDTEKITSSKPIQNKLFSGVLGARVIKKALSEEEIKQENSAEELKKNMNDVDVVRHFDALMGDKKIKTAIVFTNFDNFIKHTHQETLGNFSANISHWEDLSHDNENIVVFIAPKDMIIQKNENNNDRYDVWSILNNKRTGKNTIFISQPYKDEIRNLINYYRITKGMKVEWLEFDECIELLRKIAKEKNLSLKNIASKLKDITERKIFFNKIEIGKAFSYSIETIGFEKLKNLQGLDYLATEIERLVNYAKSKKIHPIEILSSEVKRIIPQPKPSNTDANLNIALLGNPGTGKTTVAQIIAEVYKENGIFEVGHIVKVSRDDLVGRYVGETAIKTKDKINQAIGGVLFIDEAYSLSTGGENDFGKEAIDTIVDAMTARAGEFAIIIAGYPNEINEFLESNPGLKRRFANQIVMKDYEPVVLESIFRDKMKKDGYSFDEEMEQLFPHFIKNWFEARDEKTFGNAGDVINLFDEIARNALFDGRKILTKNDVKEDYKIHLKMQSDDVMQEALAKLDNIIGLESVKENVRGIIASIKASRLRDPNAKVSSGHYVFKGNPGTGKTTVARILGEILKELKVLPKGHFKELTREQIIKGHVGQSDEKIKEILDQANGGILFIDEAYSLSNGGENDFGKDIIVAIMNFMENNRENFTLIVAGYDEDMDKFLDANTGLKSRFSNTIIFEDYTEDELIAIFKTFSKGFVLEEGVEERIREIFKNMKATNKHFGNGREARKLFDVIRTNLDRRVIEIPDLKENDKRLYEIQLEDLPAI